MAQINADSVYSFCINLRYMRAQIVNCILIIPFYFAIMAHHHHNHSHEVKIKGSNQNIFVAGIVLNLLFVVAELIAGFATNSMALLSDAGHNAGDVISLVLSLVSFWIAGKKSSAVFTYGYKKTTVLAALANAVILLIAVGIIGFESVHRLLVKEEAVQGNVIAWIAALGIVINAASALLFYKAQKNELNARGAYLHLLSDALVSVGVVASGIIISYTHWYWLDAAVGLVVMIIILVSTWQLLKDSFKMSVDAVPSGMELDKIKDVIANINNVTAVHHVHVWAISTTENALTAHVIINEALLFNEKLDVIDEIKHELHHQNIQHATIEMESSEVALLHQSKNIV